METNTKPGLNKKKIIAREGLIILGILAVAGLCGLTNILITAYTEPLPPTWEEANRALDSFIPDEGVPTGEIFTEDDFDPLTPKELARYKALNKKRLQAELLALEKENEVALVAKTKFEANRAGLIAKRDARLNWAESFALAGILILFCAYPLYLLVRFVVWAIRTLRS